MEDVREKHGAVHGSNSVIITEREACIYIRVYDGESTVKSASETYLTPNEARYIASKLRRLANRVEKRILSQ